MGTSEGFFLGGDDPRHWEGDGAPRHWKGNFTQKGLFGDSAFGPEKAKARV